MEVRGRYYVNLCFGVCLWDTEAPKTPTLSSIGYFRCRKLITILVQLRQLTKPISCNHLRVSISILVPWIKSPGHIYTGLVSVKWPPFLDQNYQIPIPYPRLNGLKTTPFTAAHTHMACKWVTVAVNSQELTTNSRKDLTTTRDSFENELGFVSSELSTRREKKRKKLGYLSITGIVFLSSSIFLTFRNCIINRKL